jgi:hypothetical protein
MSLGRTGPNSRTPSMASAGRPAVTHEQPDQNRLCNRLVRVNASAVSAGAKVVGRPARQRPRPAGAAARRAERPTRVSGTIRPDPGSRWSPRSRQTAAWPSQPAGAGGRGGTTLRPAPVGPGGISRRVRASAERGRVQGPGRAEADLGPRTITVTCNCEPLFLAVRVHRFGNCLVRLLATRIGTPTTTLVPTLMGTRIPTLMGTQATRVPREPGLGSFPLVRRSAGQGHAHNPRVTLPRDAT